MKNNIINNNDVHDYIEISGSIGMAQLTNNDKNIYI